MKNTDNNIKIIVAIIGAIAIIASAIITGVFQRNPKNEKTQEKPKQINFLAGTVVDQTTNKSISQAEISVVGRNEQYYTENNGNFNFPIKDSLTHVRIRVTKSNYLPYDKSFDLPAENVIIVLSKIKVVN